MDSATIKTVTMRAQDGKTVYIECHDALVSTASLARQYAEAGYADRYAVFSTSKIYPETKRTKAHEERGIYLSIILRPSLFPSQAIFLGHLSAVALTLALEEHTAKPLGIGWISALYCGNTKIGGAIVEGKLDSFGAYEYIIVTFSAATSSENFPPRLADLVKKVFEADNSSVEMLVAKQVINNFMPLYASCKSPSKFIDTYRQKFVMRGTKVVYLGKDGRRRRATVLGIDTATGALLVDGADGAVEKILSQKSVVIPRKIKIK